MKKDKYEDTRKLQKRMLKQLKQIADTPIVPPKPTKEPTLSNYNLSEKILIEETSKKNSFKKKKILLYCTLVLLFLILSGKTFIEWYGILGGVFEVLIFTPVFAFVLIIPFSFVEYTSENYQKIEQYNKDIENWNWWTDLYPKKKVLAYWYDLNGYQFEKEVATVFVANNYTAQVTSKSCDGGVDIILQKNSQTIYVQCKAYKSKIGVAVVRELYGVMQSDGVSQGIIATLEGFTSGAINFAKDKNIELITAYDLMGMIN